MTCRNSFNGLIRAYQIMEAVTKTEELKTYSILHYEKMRYGYAGLSSVRLSNRYVHRLLFEEKDDKLTLKLIDIDDTHSIRKCGAIRLSVRRFWRTLKQINNTPHPYGHARRAR